MPTVPANAKKPADRKPKKGPEEPPARRFSFEHQGETHEFEHDTAEVLTPGFIRKHRNDSEAEINFVLLESLASEETLEVLDNMSWADHTRVMRDFGEHVQASMGAALGE